MSFPSIGLFFVLAAFFTFMNSANAQTPASVPAVGASAAQAAPKPQAEFPIYAGTPPDGHGGSDPAKDIPTLTPFWPSPDKATGAAVVICPGGGYRGLAAHEGKDYALWLNERGIVGLVLKYRLGGAGYRHPAMMHDVLRAIRLTRFHAAEWKINPAQIGVMGSSAGGHLASTALTHFDSGTPDAPDPIDRISSRPDIGILCYAVISMGPLTHAGSKSNLLGENPSPERVTLLSNEQQVTKNTPPCFIWHTSDDPVVKVQNSLEFANALQKNGVPFDLHVYQHGPHGLGLGIHGYEPGKSDMEKLLPWTHDLEYWLTLQHFAK